MIFFLGILVRLSQSNRNTYSYNISSVVLCGEILKLIISVWIYLKKNFSFTQLFSEFRTGLRVCLLYMIPAFLYCLYNNLSFVNLANYDPTTYFILLQFRNVITGIIYQILFDKKLTKMQWFSLIILTFGCIVKEFGRVSVRHKNSSHSVFSIHLVLILVQIFCSCFAGVYNEYLLKDSGKSVDILIQNMYMYIDSVLSNLFLLLFTSKSVDELDFSFLSQPIVLIILFNGAFAGITTSFFLKNLNSILKTFAATLEIIISAILCYFIFNTSIDLFTILSIFFIFTAILIYSQKPVTSTITSYESDSDKNENLV